MEFEKGKLVRWIGDKGFGFITPEKGGADIFIHISALKSMSRPPVVGDRIIYESSLDDQGKLRAINATIEGVRQALTVAPIERKSIVAKSSIVAKLSTQHQRPYISQNRYSSPHKKSGFRFVHVPLLIIVAGSVYSKFANKSVVLQSQPLVAPIAEPPKPIQQFQCQGKVHCSQMGSYDEAVFYLKNCSGTKMDGDNDGIPCEQQF